MLASNKYVHCPLCLSFLLIVRADRQAGVVGLHAADFYVPFFVERVDLMEMSNEWITTPVDGSSVHLLSYSFLFPPTHLLAYFRAANHAAMFKAYESALVLSRVEAEMTFTGRQAGPGAIRHRHRLNKNLRTFFVLEVSRSNLLMGMYLRTFIILISILVEISLAPDKIECREKVSMDGLLSTKC